MMRVDTAWDIIAALCEQEVAGELGKCLILKHRNGRIWLAVVCCRKGGVCRSFILEALTEMRQNSSCVETEQSPWLSSAEQHWPLTCGPEFRVS